MPVWLTLIECAVKALIWWYGDSAHPKIVESVMKYTPLTPDANPPLSVSNNPNLANDPAHGGIPR